MIRTVIVDDDFLVRSYLKQLNAWERAGYQIVADARDGEEALTAVEQLGPEVVITDISMPLMDGNGRPIIPYILSYLAVMMILNM